MSKLSKYQQIVNHLQAAIENGQLETGARLPSIRQLAKQFNCSKDTVQKALMELRFSQHIYAKPQSGYYVLEQKNPHQDLQLTIQDEHLTSYDDFRICVNESLVGRENYLFNYYDHQEGLKELRQSVYHLLFEQAIYCKLEQLVLTSGTQQALFILSQIDFPTKAETILVEQPTYHRMNQLLLAQNIPYKTIERSIEGIDLKELERQFQTGEIKFFYTIPRFHYPLGHSYSEKEREKILQLAKQYQVYLVEDDYLGDLDPKKGQTFYYQDEQDLVIYIKSFSTSLFPALRITALILPQAIRDTFVAYKNIIDYDNNLIMQRALSLYIDSQLFEKNRLARLKIQEQKQAHIQKLIDSHPLPFPSYPLHDGLLLDLTHVSQLPALKHSQLGLDFFEDSYLHPCPYQYAKITLNQLEQSLTDLCQFSKHL